MSLLEVDDLHTHFIARDLDNQVRVARALNGVTFSLERGSVLGLVGETGAGKSLTAQALMGLLRPPAQLLRGSIRFEGAELTTMAPDALNRLRGNRIAMVVQSPRASLDPLTRVGEQLIRMQRAHREISESAARERAIAILRAVGIPAPESRMRAWPFELSGGMSQRVLIALALVNEPTLLIADEPTTGLDATVQAQILELLREQVRSRNIAATVITHDLGVVAHYCDEIAVMFAGAIVERGPVREVFRQPAHPYTQALIGSTPERLRIGSGVRIGGPPPNLYALPEGCHFRDRCPRAAEVCVSAPAEHVIGAGSHRARCHLVGAVAP